MMVKPIRGVSDYEANVARLEDLIDAEPGSPESDELEILATLIERYEAERFPIVLPSPLAAIRFRMEQDALTPRDLEPYIGSRSRVSEVLSGVRPLSIDMIRALHEHLGIPAEVLIQSEPAAEGNTALELAKPAAKQLVAWGLLGAKETFEKFKARSLGGMPALAMLRKTRTERTNAKTDFVAVQAWCAATLLCSEREPVAVKFDAKAVTPATVKALVSLSVEEHGPEKAKAMLAKLGILLVVLPHLPGTHLDGASLRRADGVPVIALTLRRDRIDSFWFTLLHELAHVVLHLTADRSFILDDLDISSSEKIEEEADDWARDALIPASLWASFRLKGAYTSTADILSLAHRAEVNAAIVAGRWQRENKNFRKFSGLLGHNAVRNNFPMFECPTDRPCV